MSDSAELWITDTRTGESVSLYSRWGYPIMENVLAIVLLENKDLDDFSYFCRDLFITLLNESDDEDDLGISSSPGYSTCIIEVDLVKRLVRKTMMETTDPNLPQEKKVLALWTFKDFVQSRIEQLPKQSPFSF